MPPDIIAGLATLAGPLPSAGPPGAASVGTPAAAPRPISAALFAALLTQSSPPNLQLAAPTDAAPTVKLGSAATQQTLKNLKTMDTLPKLSFPAAGTAMKASELLPSRPIGHKTAADDKTAADASLSAVDLTAAAVNGLNAVPAAAPAPVIGLGMVPVQAVPLPPAAAPALSRALKIAAPSVSRIAAPAADSPASELFADTPPSPANMSLPTLPAPKTPPAPNAPLTRVSSVPPQGKPLAASVPAAASVPVSLPLVSLPLVSLPQSLLTLSQMPQAPTPQLPVPTGVPPRAGQPSAQEKPAPEETVLALFVPESSKTPAGLPVALPRTAALGPAAVSRGVPVPPVPLQPVTLQPQDALLLPPSTPNQTLPAAPPSATAAPAQLAAVVPPADVPTLLSPGPVKQPGKSAQSALKPAPANADTYTRIADAKTAEAKPAPTDALAPSAKAVLPAKLTALNLGSRDSGPEKIGDTKAEAKAPVKTPEAGTLTAPQAAPAVPVPSQPLSAADQVKIVHQVADGVGAMPLPAKPGGVQQMSLQLHPKDWGSLQVSVAVAPGQEIGAAKTVTAHIVAETPQVKAALQSQTGALHQALRASGLNLTHLTVSVKPAAEAAPAPRSASAGFSDRQEPPSGSSQAPPSSNQTPSGSSQAQPAAGSLPAGTQLGTSAGGSQNGRQGQPPVSASAAAQAEVEELAPAPLPTRPLLGRIDTHA